MAVRKAAKSSTTVCVENRAELVALCENCPYPDCISPDRGCKSWQETRAALVKGEPAPPPNYPAIEPKQEPLPREETRSRHYNRKNDPSSEYTPPSMMLEVLPGPPNPTPAPSLYSDRNLLLLYNLAIDALSKLMGQIDELEWPAHLHAGCESLKNDRIKRFAHLIDWDVIAKGGTKK